MPGIRSEMSASTKAMLKVIRPMTVREERDAVRVAVKYLTGDLSQRYQVFPAELRIEKPSTARAAPKRAIAVLICDYENRRTTEVLVNPQARPIRKTDLTGYQPAFLAEEIVRAREIAESDERVAGVSRVRGAFASAFGPHVHGKRGARLVGLRYAAADKRRGVRVLAEVVVDLSEQELVNFEDLRETGGQ